jgi:hypothetical protein
MLIKGMKLGRRWLYILWIATTVLWHQGGASPSACRLAAASQWDLSKTEVPPPTADFTLKGADVLEDQSLSKRPSSSPACLNHFAGPKAYAPIVSGTTRSDPFQSISFIQVTWRPVRGPPANA